ncbi:hypothetical protein LXA43DRAFT_80310 [Ganoderma leucocontextum]|nr:hypothetical protein LXA43DRAFT_80310 [Ganoderma leucocontextum]
MLSSPLKDGLFLPECIYFDGAVVRKPRTVSDCTRSPQSRVAGHPSDATVGPSGPVLPFAPDHRRMPLYLLLPFPCQNNSYLHSLRTSIARPFRYLEEKDVRPLDAGRCRRQGRACRHDRKRTRAICHSESPWRRSIHMCGQKRRDDASHQAKVSTREEEQQRPYLVASCAQELLCTCSMLHLRMGLISTEPTIRTSPRQRCRILMACQPSSP